MTQLLATQVAAAPVARLASPESLPRRLSDWQLVELTGEGSWSRIYRARSAHGPDDQPAAYAVKALRLGLETDHQALALLRREALVGRNVTDPHVVSVLEAAVVRPPYHLVMPWLEGATLAQRMARAWKPDLPVALWIARQAAEGLESLDRAGWMHGDIRPGNLMLSAEGHVTLLDLGFARRRDETGSAVQRSLARTFHYLAPEWVLSAVRADIRSDIYSLGAMLYEILSGRPPFEAGDLAELATRHLVSRPADLRRVADHLPAGVTRLVRDMLAKEPDRRPQTPGELIERLAALEIATFDVRG